jgi:hypothetical protein
MQVQNGKTTNHWGVGNPTRKRIDCLE